MNTSLPAGAGGLTVTEALPEGPEMDAATGVMVHSYAPDDVAAPGMVSPVMVVVVVAPVQGEPPYVQATR